MLCDGFLNKNLLLFFLWFVFTFKMENIGLLISTIRTFVLRYGIKDDERQIQLT